MSQYIFVFPLLITLAFCASVNSEELPPPTSVPLPYTVPGGASAPTKTPGDPAGGIKNPPGQPSAGGSGDCEAQFSNAKGVCDAYIATVTLTPAGKLKERSTSDGLEQINEQLNGAVRQSFIDSSKCIRAAQACKHSCAQANDRLAACGDRRDKAMAKHRAFKNAAVADQKTNDTVRDRIAQKPREKTPGTDAPEFPSSAGGSSITPPPGPGMTPQSTAPQAARETKPELKPETTPEQAKQEKRELKREERRQERIDALGKAFLSMNQQQPLNQAIQEKPTATAEAQALNAAATAAVKSANAAGPVVTKEKLKEEEEEVGRAGFNALAMKNLSARKKLAAALGIASGNLPGASAIHPMAVSGNGSGSSGGPAFGSSGGFQPGADAATLDPVVDNIRPSDLPQNFRLGAPTAGGGGGGNGGSNTGSMPAIRAPGQRSAQRAGDSEDERSGRRPAGLEHNEEIRTPAANIWEVVSESFRRHCATGRLMDCAGHLPRP